NVHLSGARLFELFHMSRATVDINHVEPWGFCDRCNMRYNLSELVWQHEWSGPKLRNTRLRVCTRTCLDVPNEQLRTIKIGPDPVPLRDPRPGFWATQET